MRLPITREDAVRLARFTVAVEAVALLIAFALGIVVAVVRHTRILDAFLLAVFVVFLLLLVFAVLSGPGAFLSRPRLPPAGAGERARWRQWFAPPALAEDREFYELVLYTGLAFLLLVIATGIALVVQALGV